MVTGLRKSAESWSPVSADIDEVKSERAIEALANKSTGDCYLKITWKSAFIWGRILGQIVVSKFGGQ